MGAGKDGDQNQDLLDPEVQKSPSATAAVGGVFLAFKRRRGGSWGLVRQA